MPFNFPVLLMCWTVAASLAAGNGCIVKPAPATTLSTLEFMRCFAALPKGLIACVAGGGGRGARADRQPPHARGRLHRLGGGGEVGGHGGADS